jgi:site-specific recombinase XerD
MVIKMAKVTRDMDFPPNIDINERKLKILEAKGGEERIVYYGQELEKVIAEYRKYSGNQSGAMARGSFGKRITSCPMHRIVRRMYVESGIYRKGLTIHSLRYYVECYIMAIMVRST